MDGKHYMLKFMLSSLSFKNCSLIMRNRFDNAVTHIYITVQSKWLHPFACLLPRRSETHSIQDQWLREKILGFGIHNVIPFNLVFTGDAMNVYVCTNSHPIAAHVAAHVLNTPKLCSNFHLPVPHLCVHAPASSSLTFWAEPNTYC